MSYILHILLLPILILLSWIYGIIVIIRNYFYDIGIISYKTFDIPIISVGNIMIGGTGKTPTVIFITKLLIKYGFNPGIVSRGYGRNSKGTIILNRSKNFSLDVFKYGDEPVIMHNELRKIPIIVSKKKINGIKKLQDVFDINVVVLDDAFQHRKIKRDLEIVTISAYHKKKDYHLLPWGKLREPIYNLKRAGQVIYTKTNNYKTPFIHNHVKDYLLKEPINSIVKPTIIKINIDKDKKIINLNKKLFAFCGIGNPKSFFSLLNKLGLDIKEKEVYKDHYNYKTKQLNKMILKAKKNKCDAFITTEKDIVKIPKVFISNFAFYVIKIEICFSNISDENKLIKPLLFNEY